MYSLFLPFATASLSFLPPSHTSTLPPAPLRPLHPSLTSTPRLAINTRLSSKQRLDPIDAEFQVLEDDDDDVERIGGTEGPFEEELHEDDEYSGRREGIDYDKDPEFAEILGSCFEDPQKAQARVEERIRTKRNKVLHQKAGSAKPIKVTFNKFDFSNSYIWFEFYGPLLLNDISLLCDTIRSWHIIGRLGGCNSMNMQLSQAPLDNKRPSYDAIQGSNVTPTTFYNIGDFEIQENLARIWVDIGTTEPLLIDILINALVNISSDLHLWHLQLSQAPLDNKRPSYDAIQGSNVTPTTFYNIGDFEIQENLARIWVDIGTTEPLLIDILINALVNISSDYIGIKQLVFGGTEFENWKENLNSEDAGCSIHRI